MTPLTKAEKQKILSRLFWDTKTSSNDIDELINKRIKTIEDAQSRQFFDRLLTSCDWYTLLKLIPPNKLETVLTEPILNNLFPKDLKKKYLYAREILSRRSLSITR